MTNYGVVAGRNELIKNADYSDVIMGVSGVFNLRTQFNDALIESCRKSRIIHKEKRGLPGLPFIIFLWNADGAGEGSRTPTGLPLLDFESVESVN